MCFVGRKSLTVFCSYTANFRDYGHLGFPGWCTGEVNVCVFFWLETIKHGKWWINLEGVDLEEWPAYSELKWCFVTSSLAMDCPWQTLGVFTPIVCFLWSESMDELLLCCIFPLFRFHMAKLQVNQNVSTKAMWELSLCSLVRKLMGLVGGVAIQNGPSAELAFLHNCGHRLGHIPSQNIHVEWHIWTHFKATSREQRVGFHWCIKLWWAGPRPPLQQGLGQVVLVPAQVQLLCSHLPKWTAPRGYMNAPGFSSTKVNKVVVKTPFVCVS